MTGSPRFGHHGYLGMSTIRYLRAVTVDMGNITRQSMISMEILILL